MDPSSDLDFAFRRRMARSLTTVSSRLARGELPIAWVDPHTIRDPSARPNLDIVGIDPGGSWRPGRDAAVLRYAIAEGVQQWRVREPDGRVFDLWALGDTRVGYAVVDVPNCPGRSRDGIRCRLLTGHAGDHRGYPPADGAEPPTCEYVFREGQPAVPGRETCGNVLVGFKGAPCDAALGHGGDHVSRKGGFAWVNHGAYRPARRREYELCGCRSADGATCVLRKGHAALHSDRGLYGPRNDWASLP